MDKFAQKRRLRDKARELLNKPSILHEKIFDPQLIAIMKSLVLTDDQIRAELVGEKIGKSQVPEDEISAKDLVKSARSNFNRREYMTGISDLVIFNKKMYNVVRSINEFKKSISDIDEPKLKQKFLFEGLSDEALQKIEKNIEHVRKASNNYKVILKEAGLLDTWYNLTNSRGRSLSAIEKRYPKITDDLRKKGNHVIDNAETLLSSTLSNLKRMASARATRKLDPYLESANSIITDYSKFNDGEKGFAAYYDSVVLPTIKAKKELDEATAKAKVEAEEKAKLELQQKKEQEQKEQQLREEQIKRQQVALTPSNPMAPMTPSVLLGPPAGVGISSPPFALKPITTSNHQDFYNSLQALSNESSNILAGYISKYAKSIQDTDLETAIKLFNIVKNIRG